ICRRNGPVLQRLQEGPEVRETSPTPRTPCQPAERAETPRVPPPVHPNSPVPEPRCRQRCPSRCQGKPSTGIRLSEGGKSPKALSPERRADQPDLMEISREDASVKADSRVSTPGVPEDQSGGAAPRRCLRESTWLACAHAAHVGRAVIAARRGSPRS